MEIMSLNPFKKRLEGKKEEENKFNNKYSHSLQEKIGKVIDVNRDNLETEKKIKSEVLDYYKNNLEKDRLIEGNINKARIYEFLKQYGLETPDNILFIYTKDLAKIADIYEKYGYGSFAISSEDTKNNAGIHEARADLIFVILNEDNWPDINDEECSLQKESCAVHEACHASRGYYSNLISESSPSKHYHNWLRTGMKTQNILEKKTQGLFLEEGFVRFIQGKYIEKYRSKEITLKIQDAPKQEIMEILERISPGLTYLNENNEISAKITDLMGIGMNVLFNKQPKLLDAFIQARKADNKDGKPLQDIAKLINAFKLPPVERNGKLINRSLYKELRDLPYSDEGTVKGFNLIQEATGGIQINIDR